MASSAILLAWLFILASGVFSTWNGWEFYNSRFSIGFDSGTDEYLVWSDNPSSKSNNFYLSPSSYSGRTCTCSCDETVGIVTSCSGSVVLKNYNILNLTVDTFHPSTTSIQIYNIPQLTVIEEGTFDSLTQLTYLFIHNTGITQIPDISNTQIWLLMLGSNNIRIYPHNYTRISWPSQTTHVALQDNEINYLPDAYFSDSNIQFIQLARNQLTQYPHQALKRLPSLKHLGLSENKIKQISKLQLQPLAYGQSNLQSLNLSNNYLEYIQQGALSGLRELKILELHNNRFEAAVKGVFDSIPKLEYLSLNHNRLKRLYAHSIINLPELVELRLHSQSPAMTNLYFDAFYNINAKLKELWVSDNSLQSFPHQVLFEQEYFALTKVYAGSNQISDPLLYGNDGFPDDQGPVWKTKEKIWSKWNVTTPNIQILYLESNGISSLAKDTFCELEYLNVLNLNGNRLTEAESSIPTTLFSCHQHLETLYMSSNMIQYIPEAIYSSSNLRVIQTLTLDSNKVTVVETGSFSQHSQLYTLTLHNNLIVTIEDGAFPVSLTSLTLQNNQIRLTQPYTFANLTNLVLLDLETNQIKHISPTTFQGCSSLSTLYLSNNRLGWLNSSYFPDCTSLFKFTASHNEIGLVGEGTFSHLSSMYVIDLRNNRLTDLSTMATDFRDISITYLYLMDNFITSINAGTFVRLSANTLDLSSNRIAYLGSDAFLDCSITKLDLQYNPMKYVKPYAFNGGTYTEVRMENLQIRYLPSNAFTSISGDTLNLYSNAIVYIEAESFSKVSYNTINLRYNGLADIFAPMFDASSVTNLYLSNNDLTRLLPMTFVGLSAFQVALSDNKIEVYPGDALSVLSLNTIDLTNNVLEEIPDGSFDAETGLIRLILDNNLITHLQEHLFDSLLSIKEISIENNHLIYLANGLFDSTSNLETLDISGNQIYHLPKVGRELTFIDSLSIDLADNNLQSIAAYAFDSVQSGSIKLSTSQLQCGCAAFQSLVLSGISVIGSSASCGFPDALDGISLLSAHSADLNSEMFACAPINVSYSQPSINVIDLTWELNITSNGTQKVSDYIFYVRCWAPQVGSTADLNATVNGLNEHRFLESDGVLDDTLYLCVVHQSFNSSFTAASDPVYFTSLLDTRKNITALLGDIELPIKYYDFSVLNEDFDGSPLKFTVNSPKYVPSPYGAWLAISDTPSQDSFSDWFRFVDGKNYEFNETVILKGISNEGTHRLYSGSFYPVDYQGWLDEGQVDCDGRPSNLAFTSAIRTGFVFQGTEAISIAGGEMMWLYLNRKLVLKVYNDELATQKACKRLNISEAATPGGALLTPEYGIVVNGKCQIIGELPAERVQLQLEIEERYHFTIFHVEREGCGSQVMIDATNFDFILSPLEEPPRDYIVYIDEDLYVGGIMETIFLADSFSAGPPFEVNILRGNEARHFTIVDATTANAAAAAAAEPAPPVYEYTSVSLESGTVVSFVECDGLASVTPDGNATATESFTINTETMYLTLSSGVDYEVATSYTMILEIIDTLKVPPLTGQATVKVRLNDINDNCPYLDQTEYYVDGIPPMTTTPYLKLNASDADSTINAELVHKKTSIVLDPPFAETANQTLNIYKQIYPLRTNITFTVVITDKGTPTRGTTANITYQLSNTCILDTWFTYIASDQVVEVDSGEIRAVVPGYYNEPYACDGKAGMEQGWIRDTLITASSAQQYAPGYRARLNALTLDPIVEGLSEGFSGGWKPDPSDPEPWLQVDKEIDYIFTSIAVQGHDYLPYWVTQFSLNYSDDGTTWHQHKNVHGDVIEFNIANVTENNTTTVLAIDPWIYGRYLRLIVLDYHMNVSVRMELYGCQQEELDYWNRACIRCEASWYCEGDGQHLPCGRCNPPQDNSTCGRSPTEHSFGYRTECEACPVGWTCTEGYGTPCGQYLYTECNTTFCQNCTQCEPGYACRGGVRYECTVGTYSDGYVDFCLPCPPGYFQNATGQESCLPCPAGYSSNRARDRCSLCPTSTYSTSGGLCRGCSGVSECPCMAEVSPCFSGAPCRNTGSGGFTCEACPLGYTGDGVTCTDIDECAKYLPCWDPTRCINTKPGFQCLACPYGYNGTFEDAWAFNYNDRTFELYNLEHDELPYQTCDDINECSTDNGGCDMNAYCHNTIGSYYCGLCKEGFMGSSKYGCYSDNFCTSDHPIHHHHCSVHADCIYTGPGAYKCECVNGWGGNGFICAEDPDQDGIPTVAQDCPEFTCRRDNCPTIPNSGQEDNDADWIGDVCDVDDDNDGIDDLDDNCPYNYNRDQADSDGDLIGDVCDNCISIINTNQLDADKDGIGDACDDDEDADGILSASDNCPIHSNAGQQDSDGDGVGDACDNCPDLSNANQLDTDQDGVGDDCEDDDTDGDGIQNSYDNCLYTANSEQADTDSDGVGDRCDEDIDDDTVLNQSDNCPYVANLMQSDTDEDYVGDACEDDYDKDGVGDKIDHCISNPFISTTDLTKYTSINLYPTLSEPDPAWLVLHDGREIRQLIATEMPAIMVGEGSYDAMDYSGTIFANSDTCDGYLGFVFGYQNNKKFYAALWRHNHLNYPPNYAAGVAGVQIKLVHSAAGPSYDLAYGLWHSVDTSDVTLLHHDPWLRRWECKTSYKFFIKHRPEIGLIRVVIKERETLITDSGDIYDTTISGGRVGLLTFKQDGGIWSNLRVQCADTVNRALVFNGVNDYVEIASIKESSLDLLESFTVSLWFYLSDMSGDNPLICTESGLICLTVSSSGEVTAVHADSILKCNTTISLDGWTNIIYRYDAEDYLVTLFVNGTEVGSLSDVEPYNWNGTEDRLLYLGRSPDDKYFYGLLDDVRIYDIMISDIDLPTIWQQAAFADGTMKQHLKTYYSMNDDTDHDTDLIDVGYLRTNGILHGSPEFTKSLMSRSRFKLTYPNNSKRKKRHSVYNYMAKVNMDRRRRQAEEDFKSNIQMISPPSNPFLNVLRLRGHIADEL